MSLMGLFQPASGPGDALADNVSVTTGSLASELEDTIETASDQLSRFGDYMASDPAKLLQGAKLLIGPYAMSGSSAVDARHGMEYAAAQYLWGKLIGSAYNVWVGPASLGPNPTCFANDHTNEADPFANGDPKDVWTSVDGQTQVNWWIGQSVKPSDVGNFATGNYGQIGLPANLADQLTGPITLNTVPTASTNVGAIQPYFDNTYLSHVALPLAPNYNYDGCVPHFQ
jgi:hypothetical protein